MHSYIRKYKAFLSTLSLFNIYSFYFEIYVPNGLIDLYAFFLIKCQGTEQIEGIFLDMSQMVEDLHLRPEVFQNMPNLRLLQISNAYYDGKNRVYCQDLQSLPNKLTYIDWEGCPLKHFPSNFKPQNLVELRMPNSQLEQVLDGFQVCFQFLFPFII